MVVDAVGDEAALEAAPSLLPNPRSHRLARLPRSTISVTVTFVALAFANDVADFTSFRLAGVIFISLAGLVLRAAAVALRAEAILSRTMLLAEDTVADKAKAT